MRMEKKIYTHPYFGEMYYLLDVPEALKGQKKRPLLIFLHGAGERGKDHELIAKNAVPRMIEEGLSLPCVTVCPQCPNGFVWHTEVHFLKDFIDHIIKEYDIDPSRVSLTGISMGGYGTWEMIMDYPEMFRKAAPVCGGGTPWRAWQIKSKVWAFHGDADGAVPCIGSVQLVDAMKNAGGDARLTLFHGCDHNSWDPAYETTKVLDWLTED